jgi:hypothetical protein
LLCAARLKGPVIVETRTSWRFRENARFRPGSCVLGARFAQGAGSAKHQRPMPADMLAEPMARAKQNNKAGEGDRLVQNCQSFSCTLRLHGRA